MGAVIFRPGEADVVSCDERQFEIVGEFDQRSFDFGFGGFAAARKLDVEAVAKRSCEFLCEAVRGFLPMHLQKRGDGTGDPAAQRNEAFGVLEQPLARRAAKAMARAYRKERIGPWDVRAPAPALGGADKPIEFADGIELIANAYGEVHPDMAAFVRMMAENRWIEGTVTPRKRPGAYCTGFAKSKTSRIYMTYTGSASATGVRR